MNRKKLFWKVYPYYFTILVGSLLAVAFYSSREMQIQFKKEVISRLEAIAQLTGNNLANADLSPENEYIDRLCKKIGAQLNTRVTIISMNGKVLGDSDNDPGKMENYGSRPEIAEALTGQISTSSRFSNTIQQEMIYLAFPIKTETGVVAVVRTALPAKTFKEALSSYNKRIILGGVVVTILATLVSLMLFRSISRPLAHLKDGAERFARGELERLLDVPNTEEIGGLAESMNKMAKQINERISTIERQRNEQEALLASMIEGVVAVDANERIININRAAIRLLNISPESVDKRYIHEVIRHAELHDFVKTTLNNREPVRREILIRDESDKTIRAHGSLMTNSDGEKVGAVIVLNDVSHLKRLESIRKDFVANVSHELKTPITSIRGFVETLLDGAMSNAEDTKRFLEIINRQTDRLNSIVNDLLTLSRIEKEADKNEFELLPARIWDVITPAVAVCEQNAKTKNISIQLIGDRSIIAKINKRQLEQAIINLIDNAIKYSDANSRIEVAALKSDGNIRISVKDQGIGIESRYLPRIFERFYRIDKARIRDVGGTGLGLAIVKHIAIAHGGSVTVESSPGRGSTFSILLPTANE